MPRVVRRLSFRLGDSLPLTLVPYPGWKWETDEYGITHHVPDYPEFPEAALRAPRDFDGRALAAFIYETSDEGGFNGKEG